MPRGQRLKRVPARIVYDNINVFDRYFNYKRLVFIMPAVLQRESINTDGYESARARA